MNRFVKNTHLLAKLMAALKKKLKVLTSSKNKETTLSAKNRHEATIVSMVSQLGRYLNSFDNLKARNFKTGEIIPDSIKSGLLNATTLGESLQLEFINKRLMPSVQRNDFFAPIKNPKIDTGLKKKKLTPKVVNLLKEDKQAFGLLGGKNTSLLEAHIYP